MKRTPTIICAAALVAVATASRADPLFDTFKSLCFDTHATTAAAVVAAEKIGWTSAPQSVLSSLKPSGEVTSMDGRMVKTKTGVEVLFLAHGKSLGDLKLDGDICAILASPADGIGLKAAAAQFAAVDPEASLKEADGVGFFWRDKPTGRKQITLAELRTSPGDPDVRAMMVYGDASHALILLAVPQMSPN